MVFSVNSYMFVDYTHCCGLTASAPVQREPPDMALRSKFMKLVQECPSLFSGMKLSFTFIELVSEINRRGLTSVNERDVRSMFIIIDRKKSNSVCYAAEPI